MAAGDKEIAKAFEETTTKNLKTVVNFSQETRKIVREIEERVLQLQQLNAQKDLQIQELNRRLAMLHNEVSQIK